VLKPDNDTDNRVLMLLLPAVFDVTGGHPVSFTTIAVLATGRGFAPGPGVGSTYTVVPLSRQAEEVILPL
jgi:hypothetical protein